MKKKAAQNEENMASGLPFTDNLRYFFKLKCFCLLKNVFFGVFTSWQCIILVVPKPEKAFSFVALDEFSLLWQDVARVPHIIFTF